MSDIVIRGAREHNLRGVDLTLPRNKLICLTGVSGSGKSSLAFDTLYAEGQRRYVESLSSYARQFLGQLPKPDVDSITGLAPSISIQQKTAGRNPRSTVGTITEIYDYLRVLFARAGTGHCPQCGNEITAQSVEQIIESILGLESGLRYSLLAPVISGQKGEYRDLFEDLLKQGFLRARVDGVVHELSDDLKLDRQMKHWIEVVVDRLVAGKAARPRVAEAIELAMKHSGGTLIVAVHVDKDKTEDRLFSANYACVDCGLSFEPPSPQLFSFNSPQGMCLDCNGLGSRYDFPIEKIIPDDSLSLNGGAIEPLGKLSAVGKWKKHIYRGVAEVIEKELGLPEGSLFKKPWKSQPAKAREMFLDGLGSRQIVFRWRHSGGVWKHTGEWEGVVKRLLEDYRTAGNPMRRRQLEKYMAFAGCGTCRGERLNPQARSVRIRSKEKSLKDALTLPEVCALSIADAQSFFEHLDLSATAAVIAEEAIKEIRGRLGFLTKCGLDYLTLDRQAPTLSGGEAQRIRLAGQIGCGLVGVVYILDEPSIGLHPRDNSKLLESLCDLRDQGNTVVVVEHDEETMRAADHIIDFGPGPGIRGGEVVAQGSFAQISKSKRSLTAAYLSGREEIAIPDDRRRPGKEKLIIKEAAHNNLKQIDVEIPLGLFVCVTGVSGSGKSSLTNDILWQALNLEINGGKGKPGKHKRINGLQHLDKAIDIDQSPIGRTPRSNPATYVKVFDLIRNLYATLPDAKVRGYKPGRFSFNVSADKHGGRCEACEGHGANKLEMDFLADIWVTCPVCRGRRFNHETLEIKFKEKSIADVLEMDIQEALDHFENVPKIARLLQTLHDVGLDYMKLGQPSPTLSGGEAQRIKLARELGKRSTGSTLYLLDEPTTGLHFADISKLLEVLQGLVSAGNTVLVVEHNVDVIKTADWVIDLGPDGGEGGGTVVADGTPEEIAGCRKSHTGTALRDALKSSSPSKTPAKGRNGKKRRVTPEFKTITVRGAAQHNLKTIDVEVPREKMSVFSGPSGSGKSSLAMDTLYAEGQRRYVESLSAYARQFLGQMPKPKVEHVHGLSPAIAIEQKTVGSTPRSTVGTVTEIYDYLRILFTRLGTPFCPDCRKPISTQSVDQVVEQILDRETGTRLLILAPQEVQVGQKYDALWDRLRAGGFRRVRINGATHTLDEVPNIDRRRKHEVEVVVDRVTVRKKDRSRIADSVESAFDLGRGFLRVAQVDEDEDEGDWAITPYSLHLACHACGRSFEPLEPQNFSFNSPLGWCHGCEGLGVQHGRARGGEMETRQTVRGERSLLDGAIVAWPDLTANPTFRAMAEAIAKDKRFSLETRFDDLTPKQQQWILYGTGERLFPLHAEGRRGVVGQFRYKGVFPAMEEAGRVSYAYRHKLRDQVARVACTSCGGSRLRDDAAAYRLGEHTIHEVCELSLAESLAFLRSLKLDAAGKKVADDLLREATSRLSFLVDVGLDYLTLSRPMPTLSGGESQRIRLAGQIGRALTGVLYVLDEPTIGLHPRDNLRLISTLHRLRDLGNTLVLVEHDREVLESSDRLFDFGPGAGKFGGTVVGQGTPKQLAKKTNSLTGQFLADKKLIPIPTERRPTEDAEWLELLGARHNNLRDVDLRLPLGTLVCITGVSGSGKSSLIEETLARAVSRALNRLGDPPGAFDELRGIQHINKMIAVDQSPLGNTPASNPATYTGVFDQIRELFARLPEAKVRGYRPGRFSFNRSGGRCEKCEGNGQIKIEMHFLPDVWVECEDCRGKRYNPETLAVQYRGKSIADVLAMSIGEAAKLFTNVPKIRPALETLCAIGLDYLTLGQAAPTLSGGEAQRVKLAAELAKPNTGRTLYLLDEPTTGLHLDDIAKLLKVLNSLVQAGNTVVVIEHNLDVIKTADWMIDLGPEAGEQGGNIVAEGTPEAIVSDMPPGSHTARLLAPILDSQTRAAREVLDAARFSEKRDGDVTFTQIGKATRMPWERDGRRWHVHDRLGHNGRPPRWQGTALEFVVDELSEVDSLAPPNWNHRSVVEIKATRKCKTWFLHAMTADEWLLKLVFRVKANAFQQEQLSQLLNLTPIEDLDDVIVNGRGKRVQVKKSKGGIQVIVLLISKKDDVETPQFREFLREARESYLDFAITGAVESAADQPWKTNGRKWHLSRKGFPSSKRVKWALSTLESLFDVLEDQLGEPVWTGKTTVSFVSNGRTLATVWTKRREGIDVEVPVKAGSTTLGSIAGIAASREIIPNETQDLVRMRFVTKGHVEKSAVGRFFDGIETPEE